MIGFYHDSGEAHLHRYLAEFDFLCNRRAALKVSDRERVEDAIRMASCKRLMYSQDRVPVTPKQKALKLLPKKITQMEVI